MAERSEREALKFLVKMAQEFDGKTYVYYKPGFHNLKLLTELAAENGGIVALNQHEIRYSNGSRVRVVGDADRLTGLKITCFTFDEEIPKHELEKVLARGKVYDE